jgi:hypothetical protein
MSIDTFGPVVIDDGRRDGEQGYDEVGRAYYNAPHMDLKGKSSGEDGHEDGEVRNPATKETANLISSLCQDGQHRPVMDFDIPARYVASTTPGHGHLYIDKPLSWDQYQKVLNVLGEVGILEAGYVGAAIRRGASFVRPEWVKKALPRVESSADRMEAVAGKAVFGEP